MAQDQFLIKELNNAINAIASTFYQNLHKASSK